MLKTINIGDTVINIKNNQKGYILKTVYSRENCIVLQPNGVKWFYYYSYNLIYSRIVLIEKWHNLN